MRSLTVLSAGLAFVCLTGFRPDDPDSQGLFRFEPGYDVEHHDGEGGRVRVHFTREGPDKVKLNDLDTDGIPDSVEQVATDYEAVLVHFAELGFRSPVSDLDTPTGDGGNDRLDVYLVDFGGQADGAFVRERCEFSRPICSGYVAQENDYTGYGYASFRVASRILASHELFHAVQAAYDADQGPNWSEGTAVWASEHFDPSLPDFEYFIDGWLSETDRSMGQEPIGPVDGYSYGLAIFAQYLSESFGDDIHVRLWERLEDDAGGVADPNWRDALAALLTSDEAVEFEDAFVEFGDWVLRCGHGGDGTFENAAEYPRALREVETLPFEDDRLRVYPMSLQIWSVSASGRAEVEVALPSADAGELEGLRVILATRDGDAVTSQRIDGIRAGTRGSIATAGADEVMVLVANTQRSGESQRPGLCIGDRAEVEACVGRIAPEPSPEPASEPGPEAAEPSPESVESAESAAEVEGAELDAPRPSDAETDGGCGTGGADPGGLLGLMGVVLGHRMSGRRAPRGRNRLGAERAAVAAMPAD